jgi:hypothetical protein
VYWLAYMLRTPQGSRNEMQREMLDELGLKASRIWKKSKKIKNVTLVQQLACFNDGDLDYGPAGELQGPENSFNCLEKERCSAAAYLAADKITLTKMIDALHSSNLPPALKGKTEISQRRKALEALQKDGPQRFSKKLCRALGDAYFAAMCPPGSVVLTSNLVDHEPLCVALRKVAKIP